MVYQAFDLNFTKELESPLTSERSQNYRSYSGFTL